MYRAVAIKFKSVDNYLGSFISNDSSDMISLKIEENEQVHEQSRGAFSNSTCLCESKHAGSGPL